MATYIFDFDGTLADSFSLECNILVTHAKYLGCKQLTLNESLELKNMHSREILQYLNVPFWRTSSFVRKFKKITSQHVEDIAIFPEWTKTLQQLGLHNQIGLLSSNAYSTVEFVLKKYQLFDLFDFIDCDHSLFGKKRGLSKLLKQKSLNAETTYYVGDEVRDIEAAHATKIHAIAVSWGFNSLSKLQLANPDHLINHIEQLLNISSIVTDPHIDVQ
jgi:phosphoglycolate phosphatase